MNSCQRCRLYFFRLVFQSPAFALMRLFQCLLEVFFAFFLRPEPLFLPPPECLFTVAQGMPSASSSGTPFSLSPSSKRSFFDWCHEPVRDLPGCIGIFKTVLNSIFLFRLYFACHRPPGGANGSQFVSPAPAVDGDEIKDMPLHMLDPALHAQ